MNEKLERKITEIESILQEMKRLINLPRPEEKMEDSVIKSLQRHKMKEELKQREIEQELQNEDIYNKLSDIELFALHCIRNKPLLITADWILSEALGLQIENQIKYNEKMTSNLLFLALIKPYFSMFKLSKRGEILLKNSEDKIKKLVELKNKCLV